MPFDFNEVPIRLFGILPQTPFPLEVSIYGYCQMACGFCFANRNRDAAGRQDRLHTANSAPALFRKIDRALADEHDPIGHFLRAKYPVCFSNTTDPFQRAEKDHRATEAFLGWAQATRTPLYIQTRGNVLFEEWERYAPFLVPGKDVVYLSICQQDDRVRRRQEPGALPLAERWELVKRLSDRGIPVVVACNPYLAEWVPDPETYCGQARLCGARGVWLEALHFTAAQADCLARPYRDLLPLANLQPMYLIGLLKRWQAATRRHDLDFFPTPKWDAYFGHQARHPECADPAWLGGRTFDFAFRLLKTVSRISQANGNRQVLFGWPQCVQTLGLLGVANPELDTAPFWYPYNAAVKADHASWQARLGKRAPFYEILRYFWNHPWECQHLVWYHPLVQALWHADTEEYACDDQGDLLAVYNPRIKHHGDFTLDTTAVDWDGALRPNFGPEGGDPCHPVVAAGVPLQKQAVGP